jgi:glycosyltransferase involved in cell wall biosynthesis
MKLCVISSKECWQDESGVWFTSGGFPLQMAGLGALFEEMTVVIVRVQPRPGGVPLPPSAKIVSMPRPPQGIARRRAWLVKGLPEYLRLMIAPVRQADVVHTPLPGDLPLVGMFLALMLGKRLLVRYCASWAITPHTTIMKRVMRSWMKCLAGGRNLMLATGVGASPPEPRMHWLFSTAVTQNEVDAVQPDLDRPRKTPPRLAFVGRLSPVKGLVPLVEAMALLRDEGGIDGGPPHLTIMGDGPLRSELEMLVKRHRCDDLIQFTGQLNRSELVGHLLQADLCVQPSLSEGFCKALLDAMLCGVPVLATDVGANRQILGEDGQRGWILPGVEPSLLAGEIRRRLQEPLDWPALRRRCHAYVEEHTLEAWSQRIADLCAEQWKIALPNGKQRA